MGLFANSAPMWEDFKALMQQQLGEEDFNIWIKPLILLNSSGQELTLACPNPFHRTWLVNNYLPGMRDSLRQLMPEAQLKLAVIGGQDGAGAPAPPVAAPKPQSLPLKQNGGLNPRFVFDRFVAGQSNEFAWAAARALAGGKQVFANTLFIASGTGLGKSHLTQAVGHQVISDMPTSRVAYLTAEDFTNQMISSLRGNKIEAFKDRFRRDCDLLLLEEVQFLAGKDKTQDELSYTLDALMDAGKKIIFTSNCPADQIKGLKPQLASRLCAGLTTAIAPPDHATRVRILQKYCQDEAVQVDNGVLEFLAQENFDDVRRLHSALVGAIAKASLTGRELNIALASEVLGHMAMRLKRLSPQHIIAEVARVYGLSTQDLASKSRRRQITQPRNLAMFLCRKHTDASYASLGQLFARDHATVIYGVEQVERRMQKDGKTTQEISFIEQRMGLN